MVFSVHIPESLFNTWMRVCVTWSWSERDFSHLAENLLPCRIFPFAVALIPSNRDKLHKLGTICTLSHENPSCGPRERLRQAVFLENAITEDKMSLRTSALAYFIQNKLYFQYIFIIYFKIYFFILSLHSKYWYFKLMCIYNNIKEIIKC